MVADWGVTAAAVGAKASPVTARAPAASAAPVAVRLPLMGIRFPSLVGSAVWGRPADGRPAQAGAGTCAAVRI
ncbi:hypothetical protein GCM10018980_47760 [Streptomyces capoamus]|uniref:Uncharacterized protein n=1 Tax=Streptomyces capoamus TaxID=68183 RepID=A0A919EYR9_9ACTN|nr:hypothetical protein GCM10010501_45320 [Streptomyces libani subsp. rufus]GHG59720.1 hypothetical protein GCM10018980_47760 [Streptomyces capoamus]